MVDLDIVTVIADVKVAVDSVAGVEKAIVDTHHNIYTYIIYIKGNSLHKWLYQKYLPEHSSIAGLSGPPIVWQILSVESYR